MRGRRLAVRTRLLIAVVSVVGAALAIAVVGFYVFLGQRLSSSATALARATAAAELSSVVVRNGRLVAPDGPDEDTRGGLVWVFGAAGGVLERPRTTGELHVVAQALARSADATRDLGERYRFAAVAVTQAGRRFGTIVTAVSLDPYEETARSALVGAILLAAVALVATAVISRWVLGRALRPVAAMTRDAAEWSEHDLDHRFHAGEPYDELTELASTFDGMLERIAASLRREQRLTAEVSHELRTPLTAISGEAELLGRRPRTPEEVRAASEVILRQAEKMDGTIAALLAAARNESTAGSGRGDLRQAVARTVDGMRAHARLELVLDLPDAPVPVEVDADLVERMLQPLLDNALLYGRQRVTVTVRVEPERGLITVDDDGPGTRPGEVEQIFQPGVRGTAAGDADGGVGLGLSLARRLARSAGGDVTTDAGRSGGSFTIGLPLA